MWKRDNFLTFFEKKQQFFYNKSSYPGKFKKHSGIQDCLVDRNNYKNCQQSWMILKQNHIFYFISDTTIKKHN